MANVRLVSVTRGAHDSSALGQVLVLLTGTPRNGSQCPTDFKPLPPVRHRATSTKSAARDPHRRGTRRDRERVTRVEREVALVSVSKQTRSRWQRAQDLMQQPRPGRDLPAPARHREEQHPARRRGPMRSIESETPKCRRRLRGRHSTGVRTPRRVTAGSGKSRAPGASSKAAPVRPAAQSSLSAEPLRSSAHRDGHFAPTGPASWSLRPSSASTGRRRTRARQRSGLRGAAGRQADPGERPHTCLRPRCRRARAGRCVVRLSFRGVVAGGELRSCEVNRAGADNAAEMGSRHRDYERNPCIAGRNAIDAVTRALVDRARSSARRSRGRFDSCSTKSSRDT